ARGDGRRAAGARRPCPSLPPTNVGIHPAPAALRPSSTRVAWPMLAANAMETPMRLYRFLPLVSLLLLGLAMTACQPRAEAPASGHFVTRTLDLQGRTRRYAAFVPARARAANEPPVGLVLHGSGERGDDGHAQTTAGLGAGLRRNADTLPALVVTPQVPDDGEWVGVRARIARAALEAA